MDPKTIPKPCKHILYCKNIALTEHKTYKNKLQF